jgi:hypothetical protein
MANTSLFSAKNKEWVSVGLVVGLTLIALFIGRLLKDSIENQTTQIERGGVKACIAKGWSVQHGIDGESTLFTTSDPFDLFHSYTVAQQPVVPGGLITDSVVNRNLERAQQLQNYQVLEQANVKVGGADGYRVKYVYTGVPKFSKIPVVMMGVDYYQVSAERILVVTMEDQSNLFDQVYPAFIKFLNGLVFTSGG